MALRAADELYEERLQAYLQLDASSPQKLRGELEHDLWSLNQVVNRSLGPFGGRRDWLHQKFGGSPHAYEVRSILVKMGESADPLWEALDAKRISHHTAGLIARRTKGIHGHAKRKEAVSAMLEDHCGIPSISSTNGLPAKMAKFVKTVESAAESIVREYAPDLDRDIASRLQSDFLDSVRIALGDFKASLNRERKGYKPDIGKVGALRFSRACEVLSLDAVYGKPVDITMARRSRAQRLKHLHPDHNPGERDPERERELHAVLEAFELLETYNQQIEEKNGNPTG